MDRFVQSSEPARELAVRHPCDPNEVMDYYDGNTVTGMWNYAQHFSMSDNQFGTTFGPSAPGAMNLVSGDTGNVDTVLDGHSPSISTSRRRTTTSPRTATAATR